MLVVDGHLDLAWNALGLRRDLKLPGTLARRGFDGDDIDNILHANWARLLRRAWGGAA